MTLHTEQSVIELLRRNKGGIASYQFEPSQWRKIAPRLYSLKRQGYVTSRKKMVQGGQGRSLTVTVWKLR